MKLHKHLQMALEVATTSKCRHKHGCVVVNNGKVVSIATNKCVGDPEYNWRLAVHAEAAAIIAAGKYAHGATVYVARVAANGSPAKSKPCKKCERYLNRYKIAKVVWT